MTAITYDYTFDGTFSGEVSAMPAYFEHPPYSASPAIGAKLMITWKGRMVYTAPRIDANGDFVNDIASTLYFSNTDDYGHVPMKMLFDTDPTYGGWLPVGPIDEEITGLAEWGSYLIVHTKGVYRVEGDYGSDITIVQVDPLHGSVSPEGVVQLADGFTVWPSSSSFYAMTTNGVVEVGQAVRELLKEHTFVQKQLTVAVNDVDRKLYLATIPFENRANAYYVSNSGSDSNDGLTESTPWLTLAKVNASTFLPDDQVLLNRGDMWREELLFPSSGLSGQPIKIGAYGTGARPEINGSQIIANGDFTQATGLGPTTIFYEQPTTKSHTTGGGNRRCICVAGVTSNTVAVTISAHCLYNGIDYDQVGDGDFVIGAVKITKQSAGKAGTTAMTAFTWDGGTDINTSIPNGTSKTSNVLTYPIVAGETYLVHVWYTSRYFAAGNGEQYYSSSATDYSDELDGAHCADVATQGGLVVNLLGDEIANVYKVACTTDPYAVWEDGEFLIKNLVHIGTTNIPSQLTGIPGRWFWDSVNADYLYVSASAIAENPHDNDSLYEKLSLRYNINIDGKNYLEISNINCSRAGDGSNTVVGTRIVGEYNVLHNMTLYSCYGHCLTLIGALNTPSRYNHIYDCIIKNSAYTTTIAIYGGSVAGQTGWCAENILEHNTILQANAQCIYTCIVLHGMALNNYIQYNDIALTSNYQTSLIMTYDEGTSNIFRYNYFHYTGRLLHAIYVYALTNKVGGGPNEIYGNTFDMTGNTVLSRNAIRLEGSAAHPLPTGTVIYNNDMISANDTPPAQNGPYYLVSLAYAPGVSIHNNRFNAKHFLKLDAASEVGFVCDNNQYYSLVAVTWLWGATTCTSLTTATTGWRDVSGQDENSTWATWTFDGDAVLAGGPIIVIPLTRTYCLYQTSKGTRWTVFDTFPDGGMIYTNHTYTPGIYATYRTDPGSNPILRLLEGCTDFGEAIDWHYVSGEFQLPDPAVSKTMQRITVMVGLTKPESGETLLSTVDVSVIGDGVASTAKACAINATTRTGTIYPNASSPFYRYAVQLAGSTTTGGEINTLDIVPLVRGMRR